MLLMMLFKFGLKGMQIKDIIAIFISAHLLVSPSEERIGYEDPTYLPV